MRVSIHSLEGTVFNHDAVSSINLPGTLGAMELLDHQAPFIASLKKGTVSLWDEKKHHHYVDIDDGFVHIKDNQCIVITSLAKVWEKNQ